jgi:EAL domain-containing protein (putative c-di-GMP-specific phosphodiesterase class I)
MPSVPRSGPRGDSRSRSQDLNFRLGKVPELRTIAEGIENRDRLQRLRAEHVDIGQGFLFARPLEEEGGTRPLNNAAGKFKYLRVVC